MGVLFERTALDECVSIDIAEKYKTTALRGHSQETKRKENNKLVRLDWDVNTGYRSTILTGRLDWDINTTKLYSQQRQRRKGTTTVSTYHCTLVAIETTEVIQR